VAKPPGTRTRASSWLIISQGTHLAADTFDVVMRSCSNGMTQRCLLIRRSAMRGRENVIYRRNHFVHHNMTLNRTAFSSPTAPASRRDLGHSLLTQFEHVSFTEITLPFVDSLEKAQDTARR